MSDIDSNSPHFVTCLCQHCNGKIEFDSSGFAEGETQQLTIGFPRFDIFANDSTNPISNGSVILVPTNGTIIFTVEDVGEVTAENLTVNFYTTISMMSKSWIIPSLAFIKSRSA